jgi:2-phospho-L-lactate guanylyltransferase
VNVALLPAKPLPLAKTRLGAVLSAADRAAVSAAMFDDVLAALGSARRLDRILVVTADARLAERARAVGALVVAEPTPRGLNAAVGLGTEAALAFGASTVLTVLSDIPLLEAADVDELLERTPQRGALLVPSKEGTGTNAMVRRPGAIFPPRFGGRSLERHVSAAERQHVACEIVRNVRIGFDVDTPEDLRSFAATVTRTATYREAARLALATPHPVA